jgi:protein phosphatase
MGGHTNGELASAVAIDTIADYAARSLPADPQASTQAHEGFQAAARECQRRVRAAASRKGAPLDLGTTLTALYAHAGFAEIAHVGDSRAYLVRPGIGMWRLTHDHTLGASFESATGQPAEGVAHILTNAIGATEEEPRVEALRVPMAAGDRFLLCSDGLTGSVPDEVLGEVIARATTAREAVEKLLARALETEAEDNVTAVVAFA